jgi:ribonuclease HII
MNIENNSDIILLDQNKKKRNKSQPQILNRFYEENDDIIEIGVDEAGRGPLFGSVYTAAVILPKDETFNYSIIKDSKKFHSKKKIEEVANYIKKNALAWYVSFEDEKTIDDMFTKLESVKEKKDKVLNEQISKMKNIIGYNKTTQ